MFLFSGGTAFLYVLLVNEVTGTTIRPIPVRMEDRKRTMTICLSIIGSSIRCTYSTGSKFVHRRVQSVNKFQRDQLKEIEKQPKRDRWFWLILQITHSKSPFVPPDHMRILNVFTGIEESGVASSATSSAWLTPTMMTMKIDGQAGDICDNDWPTLNPRLKE